eukprot:jgi/Tetstr1/448047/TSEL_035347.t1
MSPLSISAAATQPAVVARASRPTGTAPRRVVSAAPRRCTPSRASRSAVHVAASYGQTYNPRADESPEQAAARRRAESERVMSRSQPITSQQELDAFLTEAGNKLVFLTVESTEECDLGDNPAAWTVQRTVSDDPMAPCLQMKDTLQRVARECSDAIFLTLTVGEGHSKAWDLARELGVTRFPTFQYYMNNELVWEHVGASAESKASLGEGMLYYGNQAAGGVHASDFITPISNKKELNDFLELCAMPQTNQFGVELDVPCDKQLAVLDVSYLKNSPGCVHVYPAVLALAKNTAGACRWARLAGDSSAEAAALMKELNVTEVPTFVFFEGNREVGRYSGTDRYGLMNKVIAIQQAEGVKMPDRPTRKRIPVAEAKRIAQEARAKAKANQWN